MDQEQINVVWKSYNPDGISRGYWDQALLEDMTAGPGFVHHEDFEWLGPHPEIDNPNQGAIVIVNGRMHDKYTGAINHDINKLRWVLFIITGDEEAIFPWREIRHPIMRVWVQLPRMNEHNDTSFKLPNGPRPQTRELLTQLGKVDKSLDFMFAGQINHDRREQCLEAARSIQDQFACHITGTDGFGKEVVPYPEYMRLMASSRVVLCPSGIESPDNFRLYEALEAGCVPVVDAFATRNQAYGFWKYLFEEDVPFPIVDYWDKLPMLLPELLREYPHNANKISAWWQNKKREMRLKLLADVKELSK